MNVQSSYWTQKTEAIQIEAIQTEATQTEAIHWCVRRGGKGLGWPCVCVCVCVFGGDTLGCMCVSNAAGPSALSYVGLGWTVVFYSSAAFGPLACKPDICLARRACPFVY